MGLLMAYDLALEGALTGLTRSTDHPSKAFVGPTLGTLSGWNSEWMGKVWTHPTEESWTSGNRRALSPSTAQSQRNKEAASHCAHGHPQSVASIAHRHEVTAIEVLLRFIAYVLLYIRAGTSYNAPPCCFAVAGRVRKTPQDWPQTRTSPSF